MKRTNKNRVVGNRSLIADINHITDFEKPKINNEVKFDLDDGINFDKDNFTQIDNIEMVDVELSTDEVIALILESIEKDIRIIAYMGIKNNLHKALKLIQDRIQRKTNIELDLISLFKNDYTIKAGIQLIACGYLISDKMVGTKSPVIVFLPNINNIYVTVNAFGQGLHKYKNKLAITSLDERLLNKANKSLFGSFGSFKELLNSCKHIELTKPKEIKEIPISHIRALSKRELVSMVLDGTLTIADLHRANIQRTIIQSIKTLI